MLYEIFVSKKIKIKYLLFQHLLSFGPLLSKRMKTTFEKCKSVEHHPDGKHHIYISSKNCLYVGK